MTPPSPAFPRTARLRQLARELHTGASSARAVLAGEVSGPLTEAGVKALFAAAILADRSDLALETAAEATSLRDTLSVAEAAGAAWHEALPHPERAGGCAARLEAFCGLSALLGWTRGESWRAIATRLDEAEVSFLLEDGDAEAAEAAEALGAILPEAALARARTALLLLGGGLDVAQTLAAADEQALERARDRTLASIPLTYVLRDHLINAGLASSVSVWAPEGGGRQVSVAYASELGDTAPEGRVQLARFEEDEANLVLGESVTLEWWSAKAALPERCLAVADSGGEGLRLSEARSREARARQWRLDVPRGGLTHFEFQWSDGRAVRVSLPAEVAETGPRTSSGRSSGSAPGSSGRSSGSAPGSSGRSSGSAPGSSGGSSGSAPGSSGRAGP